MSRATFGYQPSNGLPSYQSPEEISAELNVPILGVVHRDQGAEVHADVLAAAEGSLHLRGDVPGHRRVGRPELTAAQNLDNRRVHAAKAAPRPAPAQRRSPEQIGFGVGRLDGKVGTRVRLDEGSRWQNLPERQEGIEHGDARSQSPGRLGRWAPTRRARARGCSPIGCSVRPRPSPRIRGRPVPPSSRRRPTFLCRRLRETRKGTPTSNIARAPRRCS